MGQTSNSPHQKGKYRDRAVGQIHKAMTQVYIFTRKTPRKKKLIGSLCCETAPDDKAEIKTRYTEAPQKGEKNGSNYWGLYAVRQTGQPGYELE